ncbi:MAG TPA: type VI secretion system membrane subunit TssM [Albitalea sp.]|uniref:type VI secretion system membrane subunit TssM n=1 Tax=Piscinibacter sp. TaxID=1903157 RepID=UPI002ED2F79E
MGGSRRRWSWVRPLLSVLGVAAAAALLWFVGPLVAIAGSVPLAGERARWVAILVLVAAAALRAAWRAARSARRNRRLMDGLVAQADKPSPSVPGAAEVALIGKRFEQAIGLLKRSRLGGRSAWLGALSGRPYLYELPWYIIIGAPGAGKTTALVNSGLEFPLAAQVGDKVVRGIGGTRNCDWWFASDAVLIDTAGRYTTHDSDTAADRGAWLGFLGLLARYRPRRPINGVLLTVSVSDLFNANAQKRNAHALQLRARIEELHERLGIAFPVYVLVTKTDLLAGFMEFFADFDKDERAQVWGATFPHQADSTRDGPLLRMASDFAALEKRLNDCLVDRLNSERDRERRAAIHAFTQQWRVLRQTLHDFLQTMFSGMRAELRPMVRGVYFTSATQEGTPMDRALGGLARALGLSSRIIPPARPSGKTFFVTRLLRDVVFAESGLAGTNLRWQRRRAVLEWALMGVVACAVGVVGTLSWRAYASNREQVAAMGARLPELEQRASSGKGTPVTDLVALVPALDALAALRPAAAPDAMPLGMGLDRVDMLAAAGHDAYQRALREAFLPRIAARLEDKLKRGEREHVGLTYEALKAYLMLFGGRNFDRTALRAYLHADWDATLPKEVGAEPRDALRRHLDRLLDGGEVGAPSQADPQVVAGARALVASVPLAQRAWRRLKQLDLGPEAVPFSVEGAGGPLARRVFVRASGQPLASGIPALFTRAVWSKSVHERTDEVLAQFAREESWVLGSSSAGADPAARKALAAEVERLYLAEHAARWGDLMNDLRLAPAPDLAANAELTQLLARPDSPLLTLLRVLARELSLYEGRPADDAGEPRFEALRRYVAGQPSPADGLQPLLGKLSAHLAAADDAVKRKTVAPASEVTGELAAAAERAPEPVRSMLAQLAVGSGTQVFVAMREPLSRQVAAELAPACSRVAGRYPLVRNSREEVSRDDFAKTFGAGGLIDGFFQRHLAAHTDTSGRSWTWRGADGGAETLQPFQRAHAIREAFFRDGGKRLALRLDFRLLELDPGVGEFTLDVDGQVLRFRAGSQAPQSVTWPGPGDASKVVLQITPASGAAGPGYSFQGPWALFRLLDRVRIDPGPSPERSVLAFDVEGRKARFEVRSSEALNPAARQEMEQFQCPKRL